MKKLVVVLILALMTFSFTGLHKYYVSITQVDYVKEKESVQIITRLFIDDFQKLLRERYDDTLRLDFDQDEKTIDVYIKKYLKEKLIIKINDAPVEVTFLGKEYDKDIVYCYLEVENVKEVNSFFIQYRAFFDIFDDQKNVVRTNINNENKTFILNNQDDKGLLNFN